ncbi:IGF-like family receptor 1 [Astyanax mexicanus]|uniref:IGF-like family receptor 1 n=1 Tax=Astyanax mexicanus TaxID=7994 RepID=UPI0020CB6292|nr:IGF-like family receptor 1 [Astyanax mexicanus]
MSGLRLRSSEHSLKCWNAEEYWNTKTCVRCETKFSIKAGYEFTANCGLSDDGGRHEGVYRECAQGTFNDGTFVRCKVCSTCQASELLSACTTMSDSRCCGKGQHECKDPSQPTTAGSTAGTTTEKPTTSTMTTSKTAFKKLFPVTTSAKTNETAPTKTTQTLSAKIIQTFPTKVTQMFPAQATQLLPTTPGNIHDPWLVPVAVTFIILLFAGLWIVIHILKKRNCREIKRRFSDKRNHIHLEGSNERLKAESTKDLLDINNLLSQEIQAAPLQSVLNNLDVVDELVLLLDPDTPGAKNTRHLAANCSIPFTWINYAYSMKESKSPLVAMLEKVIAKNPNWNVGHLAGLLNNIERNDAVAVLAKITLTEEEV